MGGLGGSWGALGLQGRPDVPKNHDFFGISPQVGVQVGAVFDDFLCFRLSCFSEAFLEGYRTPFLMDLERILEAVLAGFW